MSDDDSAIHTETISWDLSTTTPMVINETPRTRIVFTGEIYEGKVRGYLCRQKKGADGEWLDVNEVNFNQIPADAGVKIELDTEATAKLYGRLTQLRALGEAGLPHSGIRDYVVAPANEVVHVEGRERIEAIRHLLLAPLAREDWNAIVETAPNVATKLAEAQVLHERIAAIGEYELAMTEHPDDESFWQAFFKEHPWMLEAAFSAAVVFLDEDVYIGGKRAASRHGLGGVVADFLFADESTKSFAVVELKTPSTPLVGRPYRGASGEENEVFAPSFDLAGAVVQVRNQIAIAVTDFDTVLRDSYPDNLDRVHPKGVLIVGQKESLEKRELVSFNHFRHGQFSLTVITYDELLRRLQIMYTLDTSARVNSA